MRLPIDTLQLEEDPNLLRNTTIPCSGSDGRLSSRGPRASRHRCPGVEPRLPPMLKLAVSVRVPVWLRGDVALQRWLGEPADAGFGGKPAFLHELQIFGIEP